MRGTSGHPVSVGVCGDPALVTSPTGGTPDDPCPSRFSLYCHEADTRSWIESAKMLKSSVSAAWSTLISTEDSLGVSTEQVRLEPQLEQLMEKYKTLAQEPSAWAYGDNTEDVVAIISWMQTAACVLEQIQRAIRRYKVKPPSAPTPLPGGAPRAPSAPGAAPPEPPVTQQVGETVLVLLGVGLLAGGVYLYTTGKLRGATRTGVALPPPK